MGKGKGLAIAGIALVAFIVIAFTIVPSVNMPNSINLQWSVYGLKDGQIVTPPLAFIAQGVEVDSLGAECSWAAEGDSVDWDTLIITGDWSIFRLDYHGQATDITTSDLGRTWVKTGPSAQIGSTRFNVLLDTLVVGQPYSGADDDGPYWDLRIELHVTGSIHQAVGDDTIQDSLDDYVLYRIYWQDGTFGLTGGIGR
jgi:hypothetical protein